MIERWEDKMGYGVFSDVFQGDWQGHNVFKSEALSGTPCQQRKHVTSSQASTSRTFVVSWHGDGPVTAEINILHVGRRNVWLDRPHLRQIQRTV